jgi:SAM-dependent methyltransferase
LAYLDEIALVKRSGVRMSIDHLRAHHGDISAFHDAMIETSKGRFNSIWWGIFDTYATPSDYKLDTIVDLGTGPGLQLPMIRERHPKAKIVAIELRDEMIATAAVIAEQSDCQIIQADLAEELPIDDNSVDLATCVMVLHEMVYPPALMKEVSRILRPGGRLIIYDWVSRNLRDYMDPGQALDENRLQHFREHCLFSQDDLAYMAEIVGLRVLEVIGRRGGRFAILAIEKPHESLN